LLFAAVEGARNDLFDGRPLRFGKPANQLGAHDLAGADPRIGSIDEANNAILVELVKIGRRRRGQNAHPFFAGLQLGSRRRVQRVVLDAPNSDGEIIGHFREQLLLLRVDQAPAARRDTKHPKRPVVTTQLDHRGRVRRILLLQWTLLAVFGGRERHYPRPGCRLRTRATGWPDALF
jgi:hypothetical protein